MLAGELHAVGHSTMCAIKIGSLLCFLPPPSLLPSLACECPKPNGNCQLCEGGKGSSRWPISFRAHILRICGSREWEWEWAAIDNSPSPTTMGVLPLGQLHTPTKHYYGYRPPPREEPSRVRGRGAETREDKS